MERLNVLLNDDVIIQQNKTFRPVLLFSRTMNKCACVSSAIIVFCNISCAGDLALERLGAVATISSVLNYYSNALRHVPIMIFFICCKFCIENYTYTFFIFVLIPNCIDHNKL